MSASLMADVYKLRDPALTPADRSVLLAYAFHVNHKAGSNRSWASAQTISAETGYSADSVSRSVAKLRSRGYLHRVGKQVFGKGVWTWIYLVTADADAAKAPLEERNLEAKAPLSSRQGSVTRSNNRDVLKPDVTTSADSAAQETLIDEVPTSVPKPVSLETERRNRLWDSVVEGCGKSGGMPKPERAQVGKAVKDLGEIGASPDEVADRAGVFLRMRRRHPSPMELVLNWSSLAPSGVETSRDTWLYR